MKNQFKRWIRICCLKCLSLDRKEYVCVSKLGMFLLKHSDTEGQKRLLKLVWVASCSNAVTVRMVNGLRVTGGSGLDVL